MRDSNQQAIEGRVKELRATYREIVAKLGHELETPEPAALDSFLEIYQGRKLPEMPSEQMRDILCQVQRMKVEVDWLWVHLLIPAVESVAAGIRIPSVRKDPEARAEAARSILARVYETLVPCLIEWRGEGSGVFTDFLRATVANVRTDYERRLIRRLRREELPGKLPERASDDNGHRAAEIRRTHDSLLKSFLARAGETREAQVLLLHFHHDLTHQEIGRRLGISEANSRYLLHRAMVLLRDCAGIKTEPAASPQRSAILSVRPEVVLSSVKTHRPVEGRAPPRKGGYFYAPARVCWNSFPIVLTDDLLRTTTFSDGSVRRSGGLASPRLGDNHQ